jgi:arsenate reductase
MEKLMATIIFYEKPGCINGEKQKAILLRAGHELHCVNILTYHWNEKNLLPFIAGKTPVSMMNGTAPALKTGLIDPSLLSFEEAMSLMIRDPILIKRPLVKVDDLCIQGFDDQRLRPYLGCWDERGDVITCPNLHVISCDAKD